MVIAPFESLNTSDRAVDLNKLVPELIRGALLQHTWIRLLQYDEVEGLGESSERSNLLSSLPAHYLLKGKVAGSKGAVTIDIRLIDVSDGSVVFRDSILYSPSIMALIDHSIERLVGALKERIASVKTIVYGFARIFESKGHEEKYEFLKLALPELVMSMVGQEKVPGISLKQVSSEDVLEKKEIDAFVTGEFTVKNGDLTIDCKIREGRSGLIFPIQVKGKTNFAGTAKILSKRMLEVIRGRTTLDGKWKQQPILFENVGSERYLEEGRRYVKNVDYYSAIMMFRKGLELNSGDLESLDGLALSYLQLGDLKSAVDTYNDLIRLTHSNTTIHSRAYQGLGTAYLKSQDYAKAVAAFLQSLASNPTDTIKFDSYKGLGDAYFLQGHYDKAMQRYLEAQKYLPDHAEVKVAIGNVYLARGLAFKDDNKLEEAISDLKNSLRIRPTAEAHVALAKIYLVKNNFLLAGESLKEAIRLDPRYDEAYWELEELYRNKKETREFVALLQDSINHDPNYSLSYLLIGNIKHTNGEFLDAIKFLEKAHSLDPKSHIAQEGLASAYFAIGDYDQAIENYSRASEIQPTAYTYASLADLYRIKGDYGRAEGYIKKALQIDEEYEIAYIVWAYLYNDQKKDTDALRILKDALAMLQNSALLHTTSAELQRLNGRLALAEKAIETAVKIAESTAIPDNIKAFAYATRGRIQVDQGDEQSDRTKYENAIKSAEIALQYDTRSDGPYILIRECYQKLGKPQEAEAALLRYENSNEPNVWILTELGNLYEEVLSKYDKAYDSFKRAYDIGGNNVYIKQNFTEANFIRKNFEVVLELANEVLAKNVSPKEKLVMKMFRIASLLFLGKQAQAFSELGEFSTLYRSSQSFPEYIKWSLKGTRKFLESAKYDKSVETNLIFKLIDVVEAQTKRDGEVKLQQLEESLPDTLKQLQVAIPADHFQGAAPHQEVPISRQKFPPISILPCRHFLVSFFLGAVSSSLGSSNV
jgi:tetratricopeptide (TPR) repeat protein/TolB-like protein